MLTIHYNSNSSVEWRAIEFLFKANPCGYLALISYIEADGVELSDIGMKFWHFSNEGDATHYTIPFCKNVKKMRWSGDIAKTILVNL